MEKFDNIQQEITEIKVSIAELPEKILEKANEKFASKLTEKVVYALLVLVFLAAVGFWFTFINESRPLTSKDIENIVEKVVETKYIEKSN